MHVQREEDSRKRRREASQREHSDHSRRWSSVENGILAREAQSRCFTHPRPRFDEIIYNYISFPSEEFSVNVEAEKPRGYLGEKQTTGMELVKSTSLSVD